MYENKRMEYNSRVCINHSSTEISGFSLIFRFTMVTLISVYVTAGLLDRNGRKQGQSSQIQTISDANLFAVELLSKIKNKCQ